MTLFSSFLILVLALTVHARTIVDASCETHIDKLDTCMAVISFSGDCQSTNVSLRNTEYAACTADRFFWSYPVHNMTLTIETLFTQKHQPFTITLDNDQLTGAISNVYRIIDNHETEVTTHDKTLIQHSDSNYQIILKFQGPPHLSRYGVSINYKTV